MPIFEADVDDSLAPIWSGEVRPSPMVKREMSKVLAEKWARELILEQMGLRTRSAKSATHDSTHYVVYDLHEAEKHRQTKRLPGIKISSVPTSFRGFVRDLLAREIQDAEALRPRYQAAKKRFKQLNAMNRGQLQSELENLLEAEQGPIQERLQQSSRSKRPSVRVDLVGRVCSTLEPKELSRLILLYEVAHGPARSNTLSRAFALDEEDDDDPTTAIIEKLTRRLVPDLDSFMPEILDNLVLEGSAKVLADLYEIVQNALPDFVVLEGSRIGHHTVWRHAMSSKSRGTVRS